MIFFCYKWLFVKNKIIIVYLFLVDFMLIFGFNLNLEFIFVCNNVIWVIGEIFIKMGEWYRFIYLYDISRVSNIGLFVDMILVGWVI